MSYITIGGVGYKVEVDSAFIEPMPLDNDNRNIVGGLLTDRVALKYRGGFKIIKKDDNSPLSIADAMALITSLLTLPYVAIGGDYGTYNAKFKSIRGDDGRLAAGVHRVVTATFETV